jgi:ABC-type transporter Mla MlaB component
VPRSAAERALPAFAVRPGEHACCRFAQARDDDRLLTSFIRDGLGRAHKVVCFSTTPAIDTARLAGTDAEAAAALADGRLDVLAAHEVYLPDGRFEVERMVAFVGEAHARVLRDGYAGLSLTGDTRWAASGAPGCDRLAEYEQRVGSVGDDQTLLMLCRYDMAQFPVGSLSDITAAHQVEVSPELMPIGRTGDLACARLGDGRTLRLAGELDYDCADTVAGLLAAHFHGELRLDLADLHFVDVAGMRALRSRTAQPLKIVGASEQVLRLIGLMAWDADPGVEVLGRTAVRELA